MSVEFLLSPNSTEPHHSKDFEKLTKNDKEFYSNKKGRFFGYCPGGCKLKIFKYPPSGRSQHSFFQHAKNYYSPSELFRLYSCSRYNPRGASGSDSAPIPMDDIYLKELTDFLKDNSYWIYSYINRVILKDYGNMSADFFINNIKDIFISQKEQLSSLDKMSEALIPYNILSLINMRSGNINFADINLKTIGLDEIKKDMNKRNEYFNYIHFSLRDEFIYNNILGCEVVNYNREGLPRTIHTYKFKIDPLGLSRYISNNKKREQYLFSLEDDVLEKKNKYLVSTKKRFNKINDAINNLFT